MTDTAPQDSPEPAAPNLYAAVDQLDNPEMVARLVASLKKLARDPISDGAQVLVRLRVPGSKTLVIGIEPEDYKDDD